MFSQVDPVTWLRTSHKHKQHIQETKAFHVLLELKDWFMTIGIGTQNIPTISRMNDPANMHYVLATDRSAQGKDSDTETARKLRETG